MSKRKKRGPLIFLLLLLIVAGIVYSANWILQEAHKQMLHETEQNLKTSAERQIALLTVWYGALDTQIKAFVNGDMLRLFASEVESAKIDPKELLRAANPSTQSEGQQGAAKEPDPTMQKFLDRLPLLVQQLREFVNKNSFVAGAVLDPKLQPYLVTDGYYEPDKEILATVVSKGEPLILPIRKPAHELFFEIAVPIFAPSYVDQRGTKVVAVFLGTCSVQQVISAIDQIDTSGFFTSAILEQSAKGMYLVDPLYPGGHRELPKEWTLKDGILPLEVRHVPTRGEKVEAAYCLAQDVKDLPWFVLQARKVDVAEADYNRFRKNVYIGCGLLIALAIILIVALGWWLMGRREHAIAQQMRKLFLMAREQRQILDGVNTALSAGVVLNDLSGVIYYVNQKYAEMAHMAPEQMNGMRYELLPYALAKSLVDHTLAINDKPTLTNFTEIITIGDEARHYLTACTPFTDAANCLVGMVSVYSDITELVEAQNRAQHMVTQTVAVFVRAIEAVDPYLCGQSSRTAQLAEVLAKAMNHDDEETLATLRTAASLSQIGMIQLPSSLLLKTGPLTPDERKQMQQHVEYARVALEGVDFGLPVLEAITQMYERLDGSGYPKHLKADAICLNARILAVANTFCALMRPRSYRTAHTTTSALNILSAEPAKYDLDIVQALRRYLETKAGQSFLQNLLTNNSDVGAGVGQA
ncbi:MAG: PAS domain-containing protein [Desulfovibrionaceae bacterium]|nr:PAS domain-containing protein [Desulfovibrionaceae bacterium]